MYAASSSVSAPPRSRTARLPARRRPLPRPHASGGPGARRRPDAACAGTRHPTRSAGDSTCPARRARSCARRSPSVHRICPEFAPVQVLRRSGRSVLLVGTTGRSTAVAKCLLDHSPVWARAVPARNSRIPRVRPAPPTGAGAAADRRGPGQLHAGDRADAGPGGGPAAAPGGGAAARRPPGGPRRDLPAQRVAAAGRDCSTPRWTTRDGSPATTSWVCSPTGTSAICRSCCTASRTPSGRQGMGQFCHGDALLSNILLSPAGPVLVGLGARGLVPAGLRPGDAVGGARRRAGGTRGRSASSPSRRARPRGTRSW